MPAEQHNHIHDVQHLGYEKLLMATPSQTGLMQAASVLDFNEVGQEDKVAIQKYLQGSLAFPIRTTKGIHVGPSISGS